MTATYPGTDLGHDLRLALWADVGALEIFVAQAKADGDTAREAALTERLTQLYDALANVQPV